MAVVIYNDAVGAPALVTGTGVDITIPSMVISHDDGEKLRAALAEENETEEGGEGKNNVFVCLDEAWEAGFSREIELRNEFEAMYAEVKKIPHVMIVMSGGPGATVLVAKCWQARLQACRFMI